uniref:Uncharacterized protein n=1 Tax=Lotharella globosa TaxID=91324 RepID=A0A7S4DX70_9EUKA|mmetsp:Transcript_10580/g.20429  ORF Transcript_10580/g.20429 Transcript_10580/m.20429 type:complete len:292 (+) Transcript_10580:106-981(+)
MKRPPSARGVQLAPLDKESCPKLPPLALKEVKALANGKRSLSARARAIKLSQHARGSLSEGDTNASLAGTEGRGTVTLTFATPSILDPYPKLDVDDLLRATRRAFSINRSTAKDLYDYIRNVVCERASCDVRPETIAVLTSEGRHIREEAKKLFMLPLPKDNMLYVLPHASLPSRTSPPASPPIAGVQQEGKATKLGVAVGITGREVVFTDDKKYRVRFNVDEETVEGRFSEKQTCADLYKYVRNYWTLTKRQAPPISFTLRTQRKRVLREEPRPLRISPLEPSETVDVEY